MQCPNCKHEISNTEKFCPYCGSQVVFQTENQLSGKSPNMGKNKKRKKWWIALPVILLVAVVAIFVVLWLFDASPEGEIVLSVSENYLIEECSHDILFTAEAETGIRSMVLYTADGEKAGELHDDGEDGDEIAGDGIYSCPISAYFYESGDEKYYAKAGRKKSNEVKLYIFAQLTEETAEEAQEIYQELNSEIFDIEDRYIDSDGSVPETERQALIEEVEALLEEYVQAGDIVLYETENDSIYIKFASGLSMVYQPTQEGVSGDGTDTKLTVWVYQPNPDVEDESVAEYVENAVDNLANCDYIENYTGKDVGLDLVKTFPNDSVVLWNGHGGYGPIIKSFLATGEEFDWAAWFFDWDYYVDCVTDRVICRSTDKQSDLACVTYKFVDYYCQDLSNSVFLLASCHSAQDDLLANAFINNGAEAVLGFTDTVYTGYCQTVCCDCLGYMTTVNPETGSYYTLSEALDEVTDSVGEDDLVWARQYGFSKSQRAEPAVIGNGEYRLAALRTVDIILSDIDDSTMLEDASVTMDDKRGTLYQAQQVTGENGEIIYRLQLPDGKYTLTASAEGYIPEIQEIEISQDVLQELHLQSGGTLTISVTDIDTGEIVRGAIVERSGSTEVEYASWNEGIAQLHLPYGSYEIKVSADYYYASETIEVEITPDNDSVELNVELAAVRTLEGVYQGWYEANQGETGLTLTVMSRTQCLFSFYNLPDHDNAESGMYFADITYEGGQIIITGSGWVNKPETYSFVEFTGTLSEDGLYFTGTVNNSSWQFELVQVKDSFEV